MQKNLFLIFYGYTIKYDNKKWKKLERIQEKNNREGKNDTYIFGHDVAKNVPYGILAQGLLSTLLSVPGAFLIKNVVKKVERNISLSNISNLS